VIIWDPTSNLFPKIWS